MPTYKKSSKTYLRETHINNSKIISVLDLKCPNCKEDYNLEFFKETQCLNGKELYYFCHNCNYAFKAVYEHFLINIIRVAAPMDLKIFKIPVRDLPKRVKKARM